ncbi:MAG: HAMP domain-containing protein [Candidatus Hydrogenedentota bacterium]|nr:MAG: HAMP domain-containing protein [Candidatus Hydrogenedentota bacterium]
MRKGKAFSVAGKLALGATTLVLATIAVTSFLQYRQQSAALEASQERTASLLATSVSVLAAQDIVKRDIANLSISLRRIAQNNPSITWIAIFDANRKLLARYPEQTTRGLTENIRPIEQEIRHGQTRFGFIQILFDETPLKEARRSLIRTTLMTALILFLAALFLTLTWAKIFSKPIENLAEAAEKVGEGDLTVQVPVPSQDEIGLLSDRFNNMVSQLNASRKRLEQMLNELSTLYSVSRVINSTSDRSEILKLNLETLATGFGFSPVAILIEQNRTWSLAAWRGADPEAPSPLNTGKDVSPLDLDRLNLKGLIESDSVEKVLPNAFPQTWGFEPDKPCLGVTLRSGSTVVGILLAQAAGESTTEADQILSVVASQIAPPILISILTEKEMEKITNPYRYIAQRIEAIQKRALDFGVPVSAVVFETERVPAPGQAAETEKAFDALDRAFRKEYPETALVVRYGLRQFLAIVPGWDKAEARRSLMRAELPHSDSFTTRLFTMPDDARSAQDLFAILETRA